MGYSEKDSMVRVDFFKPSGKWYTTEAVDMEEFYNTGVEATKKAVLEHLEKTQFAGSEQRYRLAGMWAVVLEPYWTLAHPQMFQIPETRSTDWE